MVRPSPPLPLPAPFFLGVTHHPIDAQVEMKCRMCFVSHIHRHSFMHSHANPRCDCNLAPNARCTFDIYCNILQLKLYLMGMQYDLYTLLEYSSIRGIFIFKILSESDIQPPTRLHTSHLIRMHVASVQIINVHHTKQQDRRHHQCENAILSIVQNAHRTFRRVNIGAILRRHIFRYKHVMFIKHMQFEVFSICGNRICQSQKQNRFASKLESKWLLITKIRYCFVNTLN